MVIRTLNKHSTIPAHEDADTQLHELKGNLFYRALPGSHTMTDQKKAMKSFDSVAILPCKAELRQQLLWTIFISILWRNAHAKLLTCLVPGNCAWLKIDEKYDFKWFQGVKMAKSFKNVVQDSPRTGLGIPVKTKNLLFRTNTPPAEPPFGFKLHGDGSRVHSCYQLLMTSW